MGTFEESKGGPLDIREEYWEITILGRERYWDNGENIHPCSYLKWIECLSSWKQIQSFAEEKSGRGLFLIYIRIILYIITIPF